MWANNNYNMSNKPFHTNHTFGTGTKLLHNFGNSKLLKAKWDQNMNTFHIQVTIIDNGGQI